MLRYIYQDYYGGSTGGLDGGGRGLTILSRGGDKTGPARMPGSIAIMQRASSGGNMAATSPLKSNASSGIIIIMRVSRTLCYLSLRPNVIMV